MSEDQVRSAIDAIRTKLQSELEAELSALGQKQADAVAEARRSAEAAAEQQWKAKVDAVREEWSARLETELRTAREEAERRLAGESERLRGEAERTAAQSASRVRAELEQALAAERQAAVEAERRTLDVERLRLQQDAAAESKAALTEARAAERHSQLAAVERLLAAIGAIDAARSLSDALAALVKAAAAEAPRAALFLVNGTELQGWKAEGFTGGAATSHRAPAGDAGLLGQVLRTGEALTASEAAGRRTPEFAALPADRAAIAVPVTVGGVTVAVLYADDGAPGDRQVPAPWPETVQILARHASARVAYLTAVRTAQASGLVDVSGSMAAVNSDEDNGARRYARLLVSEIKLYNEGAVRAGREKRDLLHRLREEIDRARRLYEERVPPGVAARHAYFQQELVQTLADGDPACLGGPS